MKEILSDSNTFWGMHRYMLMLIVSISIGIGLVALSLNLYISSGTIQLDLSRPGYQSVSNQTDNANGQVEKFPENGALDSTALNQFQVLLNTQVNKAKAIDAFGGDPLDPNALGVYQQN
jgi:hypothetical protein